MLFQDVTIVNGMIRTKDSINDASLYEVKKNDEPNKEDLPYVVIEKKTGAKTYKATSEIDAYNWIKERTNDSIYDSYIYKGIEYERKDLWEKLKREGKIKNFFTLSEKEKLGKDGQYIIYQAPSGELFAVTRDTNNESVAYNEGFKAGKEGRPVTDNPYFPDTSKGEDWRDGFLKGKSSTKDIKFNNTPDSEFDKDELALGIKTEMEHTDSREEAESIAKDHLSEPGMSHYYTKLVKMEAKDNADPSSIGNLLRGLGVNRESCEMLAKKFSSMHNPTTSQIREILRGQLPDGVNEFQTALKIKDEF